MQTFSIPQFITICSLNSFSQRTRSLQRHCSRQQTVCPPNTDSSPRNVLWNYGTQQQTRRHKTVYAKRGCCSQEKVVQLYCTTLLHDKENDVNYNLKKRSKGWFLWQNYDHGCYNSCGLRTNTGCDYHSSRVLRCTGTFSHSITTLHRSYI